VESSHPKLTPLDELFLQRAYELAARGVGSTAPNPPVGAAVVRDERLVGEGYHRRAGDAHAESIAIAQAGTHARGATLYISLEPCGHFGRTPPCTRTLIEAGVARVVAGTLDPTEHGGAAQLREHGIDVVVAGDAVARDLIEIFAGSILRERPYVALKMAMSLDGVVASRSGVRERIGSAAQERYVRELRTAFDAVMVGAGTVRIDDPALTVRPPHDRDRPYVRVIACQREPLSAESRLFTSVPNGYAKTIVLVPAGSRDRFAALRDVAAVLDIGPPNAASLDLAEAMKALRTHGIASVLCEGGPRLGASLLAAGVVDRVYWAIAPRFCDAGEGVQVLSGADLHGVRVRFDRIESAGPDVVLSGTVCSAA
jgi:diaminohydroxyphosphoribosylaminopyrimidine deaminase / 5-amino-6-(5-phosphoribosylamino)uracil reductase